MSHDYTEESGLAEHAASYRREHKNGEETIVTVRRLDEVYIVEATDIDDARKYPSKQVDVTRTRDEAIHAAEEWMADNPKGAKPGALGSLGLGGN